MRRLPFTHQQKALMDRYVQQKGFEMTTGQVTGRDPIRGYTILTKGKSGSGISALAGDFEPGQSVALVKYGNGMTTQMAGGTPTNKRVTRAEQQRDVDATNARLL